MISVAPGSEQVISVRSQNTGSPTAYHAQSRLSAAEPFTSPDNSAYLGDLKPGDAATASYRICTDSGAKVKDYSLDTEVRFRDAPDTSQVSDISRITIRVAPPVAAGRNCCIPAGPPRGGHPHRRRVLFTCNEKEEMMFGWEGELPQPAKRTVEEMRPVLLNPQCRCSEPLYFMYRDLARSGADWQWLHGQRLRYDLTVIPPRNLCGERVKTKGHYHPKNAAGVGFPEIYEVLEGQAHYLLQSCTLDDVVLIAADAGDLVIIPPDYGHITINPSADQTLSMANIVSTAFESEYGEYEVRRGAAYYELADGALVRNPAYGDVPPVRRLGASCQRGTQRICKGPLYDLVGNKEALAFLNIPEQYLPVFEALLKG